MRIWMFLLTVTITLAAAGCTTTVTTTPVDETEMTQGPARVVNAEDIEEAEGVTSKPVEPEKPAPIEPPVPLSGTQPTDKKAGPYNPSVCEPDLKAARAQERNEPMFKPMRRADEVDPARAKALLDEMKAEIEGVQQKRAEKLENLPSKIQDASSSEDNRKKAEDKFNEAEKLYSEKKLQEAAGAYRDVLELVPKHEGALARLRQCYADMEEAKQRASVIKRPATAEEVLLLEQKFASAVRFYDDGEKEEALRRFKEVVEMIEWSPTEIDRKSILGKARDFLERIKIEKELGEKSRPAENEKPEKQEPPEQPEDKKAPEKPREPEKTPQPGDVSPY